MNLNGTAKADTLEGADAADSITGLNGSDVLIGNGGDDTLLGGQGDDYLMGGAGNDLLDGGEGSDWAGYEDATSAVKVDLTLTTLQNTGGGGVDTLKSIENVYGSAFSDILIGDGGVNYLSGGAGNDSLFGGAGDDHLEGGAGDDTLNGGDGRDVASFDDGNTAGVYVDLVEQKATGHGADTLLSIEDVWGGAGNDVLVGTSGVNVLFGNGGDDTLVSGGGADVLSGGAGSDRFVITNPSLTAAPTITDFVGGVIGSGPNIPRGDTLDLGGAAATATNLLVSTTGHDLASANASFAADAALRYVAQQQGADVAVYYSGAAGGSAVGEVILANTTVDKINSFAIVGTSTPTNPPVVGKYIDGTANPVAGEILNGTDGADTILGQGGHDSINGGAGDDLIFARINMIPREAILSDKVMVSDADTSVIRAGEGNDEVWGGAGFDDINGNQGNDTIHGALGNDWVVGGQGNDLLYGDNGDDIVYGNLGNDTLFGGEGNDWIRGGQGDDVLNGGAGNDWLWGDRGNDTITGGQGADAFHFFDGSGNDRVTDFNAAEGDTVVIEGLEGWTAAQVGADTVVTISSGETLTLAGVTFSTLGAGWIVGSL